MRPRARMGEAFGVRKAGSTATDGSACRSAMFALDVPIAATFPSEPVVGEVDLITQFAAEEEIRTKWEPQESRDNVAEPNAERRLRGK